jgi:hypothetical protein
MGERGPVGKKSDQRVRRNKDEATVTTLEVQGPVKAPKLDLGFPPHPLVQDFWDSLADSGQAQEYEPSDWQYMRITLYVLNEMLMTNNISAMKLAEVNKMFSALLVAVGDRRRMKLEIERNQATAQVFDIRDQLQELLAQ